MSHTGKLKYEVWCQTYMYTEKNGKWSSFYAALPSSRGSNFSTGSYTELTFQLLSLFTLLNALSFNSFAGLEKATIIKHLQNVSLVPPFQLFPAMSSCLFKKKLSCGLEMMMCYVLFCIQKLDLVFIILSVVHHGI